MCPTPVRIAWATDTHLDLAAASEAFERLCASLLEPAPDAVLITGDLSVSSRLLEDLRRLRARLARPLYFVLGNHDFHGSSIARTRAAVSSACERDPALRWLPAGPVPLGRGAVLIGVDGWGDHRLGDVGTRIQLADYGLIEDLRPLEGDARIAHLNSLGDREAERADALLSALPDDCTHLLFATHLPPWREACWYEGHVPGPESEWLPGFTCAALGLALDRYAAAHPTRQITVLCGHTHHRGTHARWPNLTVLTGAASYGDPRREALLELGPSGFEVRWGS